MWSATQLLLLIAGLLRMKMEMKYEWDRPYSISPDISRITKLIESHFDIPYKNFREMPLEYCKSNVGSLYKIYSCPSVRKRVGAKRDGITSEKPQLSTDNLTIDMRLWTRISVHELL